MQKEFAREIRKKFDDNYLGLCTYSRKDAVGGGSASLVDDQLGIELWLRFPEGREMFSLVFVCPPNATEWVDLFRYSPCKAHGVEGFWMDSRFLESVEHEVGDQGFELNSPSIGQVTAALARSRRAHDAIARKLGYSVEKTLKLMGGHYLTNRSEATPAFLRSLPDWQALVAVARPTPSEAEEATSRFNNVLQVVMQLGLPEFKLRVAEVRARAGGRV